VLKPRKMLRTLVAPLTVVLGVGAGVGAGSGGLASGLAGSAGKSVTYHPMVHPRISLAKHSPEMSGVQSNNWSGYDEGLLDTGNPATSISGRWTVPTATQHTPGQAESAANWVGIGGGCVDMSSGCLLTDQTLVQAGTEEDVSSSGQALCLAWWEILPLPSITASVSVHPGDRVSVSITGPGVWTIAFDDISDGQSFTQTVPYSSTMDSAEWIEEAPVVISTSGSAGEAALPNMGPANFDLGTLNGKNAALTPADEIQMVGASGSPLATPSSPDSDADGFDVCTFTTNCTAPSS
jgi:Peptidase A4 family